MELLSYMHIGLQKIIEKHMIFAVNGILFNHESERRGETFVSRKITLAAARIKKGIQKKLYLGNLDSKRDWGYAKDYVKSMWLMLQNNMPEDFVIASGEQHSVREFVELAFSFISIKIKWIGKGVQEKGIDEKSGNTIIEIDPNIIGLLRLIHFLGTPKSSKNS